MSLMPFFLRIQHTMRRPPSSLRPRKKPVQPRAVETYAWILEAAAQILEAQGIGAFNTNLVAERAGVSIGSLYQYFPGKDALLIALMRREKERLGFELPSRTEVESLHAQMVADGVNMETGVIDHERGSRFFCRAPGGVMFELNTRAGVSRHLQLNQCMRDDLQSQLLALNVKTRNQNHLLHRNE